MSKTGLTTVMRKVIKQQLVASPREKHQPHKHRLSSVGLWNRNFKSDALGCSPEQIQESQAYLRSHGITADYDTDGRLIVTSEKQFQDCAKAFGLKTGRDGYEVKDHNGKPILTGRRPVEERNKAWNVINEMLNEG